MRYKFQRAILPALLVSLFSYGGLTAQTTPQPEVREVVKTSDRLDTLYTFRQPFMIDSGKIISSPKFEQLSVTVDSILRTDSVTFVDVTGIASVDGPENLNNQLAKERAEALADWLKNNTEVDPSIVTVAWIGEDWTWFEQLVKEDPAIPAREEVLSIVASKSTDIATKEAQLRRLSEGSTWKYLAQHIFPKMRVAVLDLGGYQRFIVKLEPEPPVEEPQEEIIEEQVVEEEAEPVAPEIWERKLYLKTNAPAWLMLWVNAAVELDLAPHWSAAIPIYYSGWNYFTSKLKFRTFSVVPEIRWWPRADNMGFFLNAHFGLNQFNYAKGGDWRYQTYHGHSPALGGGIGLGYRWHFCRNHRWSMEAAVGAGVYHLDYSIFQNIHNGLIVGRRIRTFFGVDQAALSFVYSFGVERKEVRK